jgi:peptide/nickel transport system substrate-binding protein
MKGTATPPASRAPRATQANPDLTPRYDLDKAKSLMKEAGLEKGFECTMIAPNNRYVNDEKIAEAVVGMLAKINIKVNLKTMPKAQYWDEFDAQVADIQMIGWHSDTEDSGNFSSFCHVPQQGNRLRSVQQRQLLQPEVDELTLAAQSETDLDKRAEILQHHRKDPLRRRRIRPVPLAEPLYGAKKGIDVAPIINTMNFPYFGDLVSNRSSRLLL